MSFHYLLLELTVEFCHYRSEEEEVSLEGTFASETRQRDEDTRMLEFYPWVTWWIENEQVCCRMQYIDEEMAKRKGVEQLLGQEQRQVVVSTVVVGIGVYL